MLIDWFTVCAQAINFLILAWLMKRFLYKPILDAIDARENRIANELKEAGALKKEAQTQQDEFTHKSEEFQQKCAGVLSTANNEAKAEHDRLLEAARAAADALSEARHNALISDAHNLNLEIARRTQQEVFAITRRALADLAATSLEERMVDVFNRRLRDVTGKNKELLSTTLATSPDPALVRSTFELPAEQRAALQAALNETFSADIHVRFETAPELVSGIELTSNGHKVAWSVAEYLRSLEKSVGELLGEKATSRHQNHGVKESVKPDPAREIKLNPKNEQKAKTAEAVTG